MTAFGAAMDTIFADANMGVDALWTAGGAEPGIVVRVIRKSPDDVSEWNGGRVVRDTELVDLRVSDAPTLVGGDIIEIPGSSPGQAGTTYAVQGAPRRDRERLVWTAELRSR